jgi:multiple sugar transport system permease protein
VSSTAVQPTVSTPAVHRRRRRLEPYYLVAPAVIVTVSVLFFPLAYSLYVSFIRYNLSKPTDTGFVGLQNYIDNVTQPELPTALLNTFIFTVVGVSLQFLLGLGFALLLQKEFRGQGVVRTCFMLPAFLTPSIVGLNWSFMFNPRVGVVPWLASLVGAPEQFPFLATPWTAMGAIILVDLWRATPFMFLVLLAGLQALPQEAMEAAAIDGANAWQTLRHVKLPLLAPLILIALSIRGMDAFREFDLVFVLTGGGPGRATEVIGMLAYRTGFNYYDMGRASAMAYIILALVLLFSAYFVKRLREAQTA